MCWIITEALLNKSPHVVLGENLSQFLKKLNYDNRGGKRGEINRIKDQILCLLNCKISFEFADAEKNIKKQMLIASNHVLWWDGFNQSNDSTKTASSNKNKTSSITLSADFFEQISQSTVPLDFRVLKLFRQSPLAIDLYAWLTYRVTTLKRPTKISWHELRQQFGAEYNDIKNFRKKAIQALEKIDAVYQTDISIVHGGILLGFSKPHIDFKPQKVVPLIQQTEICFKK